MAENGDAVVVWSQALGTVHSVWASYFDPASGWSHAETLYEGASVDELSDYADPVDLAIDSKGRAIAAWYIWHGDTGEFWADRFAAGDGFRAPELVGTLASEVRPYVRRIRVAVSDDGSATLVFHSIGSFTSETIWASHQRSDSAWSTAESLVEGAYDVANLDVVADSAGNATAIWSDRHSGPWSTSTARFDVASGWGTPEVLNWAEATRPILAAISVDRSVIAIWQNNGVWTSRYQPGSGWRDPELIDTEASGVDVEPAVAMNGAGNAVAVWTVYQDAAYSSRFDLSAGGWGAPERIAAKAESTRVAVDGQGNSIAIWEQVHEAGVRRLWTSRNERASGWSTPAVLDASDLGDLYLGQIGADRAGNAIALWNREDVITVRRYRF